MERLEVKVAVTVVREEEVYRKEKQTVVVQGVEVEAVNLLEWVVVAVTFLAVLVVGVELT